MYEILIYPIVPHLWRWEIRRDGELLRCGTSRTTDDAESEANEFTTA